MSERPDRERERAVLAEIERALTAEHPRLARRLAYPGRWTRLWWGVHRQMLVALLALATLSLIPLVIALVQ